MIRILVLARFYGRAERGVETWAKSLQENLGKEYKLIISPRMRWNLGHFDIVISTDGRIQPFVCRILTWLFRKKMVVFGHSGPGFDDRLNLLALPNVFVAFSSEQKKWAERFKLPVTKTIEISHAVDTRRFFPAKTKPKKKLVLSVAANTPQKRIRLVEKAARLIPGLEFLAVGKGNKKVATFAEMPTIYQTATVFCLTPQPWDAFGLVFLEAMACNLPVVTTNDPVRKEIVERAGVFVNNPEDANCLATAIELALKIKWGNKPRKQAEKFSWEKMVPKYEHLFNGLVKQ